MSPVRSSHTKVLKTHGKAVSVTSNGMNIFDQIYDLVAKIPKGKVTTYGAISKIVGVDPRVVGFALHANNDPEQIPCHRVINSKGEISAGFAFGGPGKQQELLEKEGIDFKKGKVDLTRFGYFI